jgi:hypothetical protein
MMNYSCECTEASAMLALLNQGITLAPGIEIDNVVKDANWGRVVLVILNRCIGKI